MKGAFFALLAMPLLVSPARGARIDEVRIHKAAHVLELVSGGRVLYTYTVAIGWGGPGPKRWEGDAVTPTGEYRIAGRHASVFHRFLSVSYPNDEDRLRWDELRREGIVPEGRGVGFGIGIHGTGSPASSGVHKAHDWTLGCVALDDEEVDEVAALVPDGTRVIITD